MGETLPPENMSPPSVPEVGPVRIGDAGLENMLRAVLLEGLADFRGDINKAFASQSRHIREAVDAAGRAEGIGRECLARVAHVEHAVFGSNPPPPPATPSGRPRPVVGRISDSELTNEAQQAAIAELAGRMTLVEGSVSRVERMTEDQNAMWGIGEHAKKGLAWVLSREGRNSVIGLVTLAAAAWAAWTAQAAASSAQRVEERPTPAIVVVAPDAGAR